MRNTGLLASRRLYTKMCCQQADVLSVMSNLFCGWHLRDRFNILNKYSELAWSAQTDPIPTIPTEKMVMADLMDSRAIEILTAHSEGDIVVSWSGGVDSTSVICALLKNGLSKERLHVICAESSLEEYPYFYRWMLENKIRVTVTETLIPELRNVSCSAVVNGWCADQLFGSNIHGRNSDWYNMPWMDGLKLAFEDRYIPLSNRSFEIIEAVYKDYGKQLGFEIDKFCEFAWLFNFGVKWSYVQAEQSMSLAGTENSKKVIPFFDTYAFQQFAMQRYDRLRIRNVNIQPRFYKRQLKQYIYDFTNDADYFNHKGKRNSWAMVGEDLNQVACLTDDGMRIWRIPNETNGDHFGQISSHVYDLFKK